MEKLKGANFAQWKSHVHDIMILKDQYFPIEGVAKKSSIMIYEAWMSLERKSLATI